MSSLHNNSRKMSKKENKNKEKKTDSEKRLTVI